MKGGIHYIETKVLNQDGTKDNQATSAKVVTECGQTQKPESRFLDSFPNVMLLDFIYTDNCVIFGSFFDNFLFFFGQSVHEGMRGIWKEEEGDDAKENGQSAPDNVGPSPRVDTIGVINERDTVSACRSNHGTSAVTQPEETISCRLFRSTVDSVYNDQKTGISTSLKQAEQNSTSSQLSKVSAQSSASHDDTPQEEQRTEVFFDGELLDEVVVGDLETNEAEIKEGTEPTVLSVS